MNENGRPISYVSGHSSPLRGKHLTGPKNFNWKGGKMISHNGYVLLKKRGYSRANNHGYVFEHILVMEEHIGRLLKLDEVVHHINHNKQDNRIENLQLMTRSEHMKLHMTKLTSGKEIWNWRTKWHWLFGVKRLTNKI